MNGTAVPLQELQRGLAPRTGQTLAAECQKTCEWPEGRVQGTGDPRQDYGLISKKKCCMCRWEMRYIFLDLYGQCFFLPLFFCCCYNLFSTLYYGRTMQKLFGSELQRRSFLSWQDDHIFRLGFQFIIWHCSILGAVAWFSHIDSQEWPGNQVQSLWRRWGYAQVLQTRAIGAEEHRRKCHKQRVQAGKYSQRWIAWICKAYIHAEALFFSFLCFALSHSEFIFTSSTDTFLFGRDKGCFTSS